jgi:hypothetical protein
MSPTFGLDRGDSTHTLSPGADSPYGLSHPRKSLMTVRRTARQPHAFATCGSALEGTRLPTALRQRPERARKRPNVLHKRPHENLLARRLSWNRAFERVVTHNPSPTRPSQRHHSSGPFSGCLGSLTVECPQLNRSDVGGLCRIARSIAF